MLVEVRDVSKSDCDESLREMLARVARALNGAAGSARLLDALAWPREVEERFFARGASALPEVRYEIDRDERNARIASLAALEKTIEGEGAVPRWLRATVRSLIDGNRLLLALGTTEFYRLSREIFGGARTRFLGESLRNVDLADHLLERLRVRGWDEAADPDVEALSDEQFAAALRARLAERRPDWKMDVVIDGGCTAKALAGRSRIRVRRGARFDPWEVDNLWTHEVETHALTAHNGAAQVAAPFLRAGGPRATRTQEGLAVFAEVYEHQLPAARMERLALRVKLVDMAERGASFLDLYRYLVGLGVPEREAYLDAQRVCRGGRVEGGAPFTKDACYIAGLLHVHSFLSVVVRGGMRDEAEMLVAGRIALDDVAALVELRQRGILVRPPYLPRWLADWRGLLPHFAFVSFAHGIDLEPVEAHYREVLRLGESHRGPSGQR